MYNDNGDDNGNGDHEADCANQLNSHGIRVGDTLISQTGQPSTVFKIEQEYKTGFPVNNLTIEENHTFAVGPGAILVHNTSHCDDLIANAQKKYPKKAGKIEEHHVDPKYAGGDPKGPTKPIDAAYHQEITNEFRKRHPYGQPPLSLAERQELMEQVYKKCPLPPGT